jgi:hypothetical protein
MEDQEFICLSCKWCSPISENKIWCDKEGFTCNGHQYRPTHKCEEFKEGAQP